jgi:hypothetical protein
MKYIFLNLFLFKKPQLSVLFNIFFKLLPHQPLKCNTFSQTLEPLEIYMVVNFRTCEISRDKKN